MKIPISLFIVICLQMFLSGVMVEYLLRYDDIHRPENNNIQFIWNDDEESIPVDGSLIRLEFTDENNVYIGPAE
mgnify:FL=1